MRISDSRSDVCSSDLPMVLSGGTILIGLAVLLRSLGTKGPRIEWGVLRPILLIAAALTVFSLLISDFGLVVAIVATVLIASTATPDFRTVEVQIGRASCRERVGQYCEIWVGAV